MNTFRWIIRVRRIYNRLNFERSITKHWFFRLKVIRSTDHRQVILFWLIVFQPRKCIRFFRQPHDVPYQPRYLQLNLKYNILSAILTILLSLYLLAGYKLHILDCFVEQHPLRSLPSIQPLFVHLICVIHLPNLVDGDRQDGPPAHEGLLGVLGLEHVAGDELPVFLLTLAPPDPVVGFGSCLAQFLSHVDERVDGEHFDVHALVVDYCFHGAVCALEVAAGVLRRLFREHCGFE